MFALSLKSNRKIVSVDLSYNKLSGAMVSTLASMLVENESLHKLCLDGNKLSRKGAVDILACAALKGIDLSLKGCVMEQDADHNIDSSTKYDQLDLSRPHQRHVAVSLIRSALFGLGCVEEGSFYFQPAPVFEPLGNSTESVPSGKRSTFTLTLPGFQEGAAFQELCQLVARCSTQNEAVNSRSREFVEKPAYYQRQDIDENLPEAGFLSLRNSNGTGASGIEKSLESHMH